MSESLTKSFYIKIFIALITLTALTVAIAFIDLGPINNVVALLVAGAKSILVVLYFMHVRYATRLTWVVATAGFAWLAILMLLSASDYISRSWLPGPSPFP